MYKSWRNFVLAVFVFIPQSLCVVIQAEIDMDDDSEQLIGNLINKIDAIIDPNDVDTVNATKELAFALLNIGPLMTVRGNISDRSEKFKLSFSLDAKAGILKSFEMNALSLNKQNGNDYTEEDDEGYIEYLVLTLENYLIIVLNLIGHAIMTNIIANLMSDLALHSDTNLIC